MLAMTRARTLFFIFMALWLSMVAWAVFLVTGSAHQLLGARLGEVTITFAAIYVAVRFYLSFALRKALKA
jgi:hypothetical protein